MNSNAMIRMVIKMAMSFGLAAFIKNSRQKDEGRNPEQVAQARKSERRVAQSARFLRRFGRF